MRVSCNSVSLQPEEITLDALPRVRRDGVDPAAAEDLLRRAAWELMEALSANTKLAATVEDLRQERQELDARVAELEAAATRRKDPDDLVRSLLASTQRTVREQRETARREAELLLKKTRARAADIESEMKNRAAAAVEEATKLEAVRAELTGELRAALEAVLALCDGEFSPPSNAAGG
jgi:DNA repair ATPase RecN